MSHFLPPGVRAFCERTSSIHPSWRLLVSLMSLQCSRLAFVSWWTVHFTGIQCVFARGAFCKSGQSNRCWILASATRACFKWYYMRAFPGSFSCFFCPFLVLGMFYAQLNHFIPSVLCSRFVVLCPSPLALLAAALGTVHSFPSYRCKLRRHPCGANAILQWLFGLEHEPWYCKLAMHTCIG